MPRSGVPIALALCLAAAPAQAAIFVAGNTSDFRDWAPGDGSCDTSPIVGVTICTLRAAIEEANALPGDDVIQLYPEIYTLTLNGDDDTSAAGDLDVNSTIRVEGAGMGQTVIQQNAADRVFAIPFPGTGNLELSQLTLRGGDAGDQVGGGVFVYTGARLELDRVEIAGCAARIGGGLFNYGQVQMVGSWVHGNHADWRAGGLASASLSSGGGPGTTISIDDSTIDSNASDAGPTEIELANAGQAILTNTTVSPSDPLGFSIEIASENVAFSHVTVRGEITTFSFSGTNTLHYSNSAIEYCNTLPSPQPITTRFGVNASANAGCGFAAAGGIEGPFALRALADYGGPTPTHLPLYSSSWIDAIGTCGVAADQRGVARPIGSGCDVGAVEAPEPGTALAGAGALLALAALTSRAGSPRAARRAPAHRRRGRACPASRTGA